MQSTNQKHKTAALNACITKDNKTTVDKLLGPVSQEDQKQTYLSTHLIAKKIVASYRSFTVILVQSVLFVYQWDCCLLLVSVTLVFYKVVQRHSYGVLRHQ